MDQVALIPNGQNSVIPLYECDVSVAQDGSQMAPAIVLASWPVTPVQIDVSTASSVPIAPATTGKINNAYRVILTAAGPVTVTLAVGAGALVLALPSAAAIDLVMIAKPLAWSAVGAAMALVTNAAVRVCGRVDYFQS